MGEDGGEVHGPLVVCLLQVVVVGRKIFLHGGSLTRLSRLVVVSLVRVCLAPTCKRCCERGKCAANQGGSGARRGNSGSRGVVGSA